LFPFNNTKNAIVINGGAETNPAVVALRATQAIGNVMINGRAQEITANADNKGVKGVFEGINGAVYAKGELRKVNIGEGILPSGTGNFSRAGLYADSASQANFTGRIDAVAGSNADIRGDIATNAGIGKVTLHNGSIINSDFFITESAPTPSLTGADL